MTELGFGGVHMLHKVRAAHQWPLWSRLAVTGVVLVIACAFQLPLQREVPGEPFLLFFLIVIAAALIFGKNVGYAGVGLSAFLSLYFFEPTNTLAIQNAADLIRVQLYAILAGACVFSVGHLGNALIATSDESAFLKRKDAIKSILLRELAHGVANNFAILAALMRLKSSAVNDLEAKSILEEAIEQVVVIGRVHSRLRAQGRNASLDSADFFQDLCADLKAIACGRPLSIECEAERHQFRMEQAVALGLIANELVTNAVKHAFPSGRAGRIRIGFKALKGQMRLVVEDDGVGFFAQPDTTRGQGQDLIRGLLQGLDGKLEVETSGHGSAFRVSIPDPASDRSREALGALVH
jgi:two-component system, sensor histidine kinase PdtaS